MSRHIFPFRATLSLLTFVPRPFLPLTFCTTYIYFMNCARVSSPPSFVPATATWRSNHSHASSGSVQIDKERRANYEGTVSTPRYLADPSGPASFCTRRGRVRSMIVLELEIIKYLRWGTCSHV
ncbi:hypothetical protein B0H19DRAFT_211350 [Mycena capillaripes]|nr:hypothetical protein B0H19DRAFT_211350 [Mycena capillaripes]